MAFNRMSAALSVLMTRNFSKMFLRARRVLEFSYGLDPEQTSDWRGACSSVAKCPAHPLTLLPAVVAPRRAIKSPMFTARGTVIAARPSRALGSVVPEDPEQYCGTGTT